MLKMFQHWFAAASNPTSRFHHPSAPGSQSRVAVTLDELIALQAGSRGISLISARVKNNSITGAHPSRFRGRGMDYLESRSYQPGDDVRSMDWRVTARAGSPYVKMYEEERERPVMLLVDFNPGMFFATRGAFKSVIAARLAALIAWAGVANGDRIGGLVFNGNHLELQPRGGSKGALHLFRLLVQAADPVAGTQAIVNMQHNTAPQPGGNQGHGSEQNSLGSALQRCRRVSRPGSLIFILSDFYQLNVETKAELLRLRQHNDVVAIQIMDPLELTPPPSARYGVSDGQHDGIIDTRKRSQRDDYLAWCKQHHAEIEQAMRKRAIPLLQVATTDDVGAVLRQFMPSVRSRSNQAAALQAAS